MSFISSNAAKKTGKAYSLKNDTDLKMFDDLWEVFQVGRQFERKNEELLHCAVEKSYRAINDIAAKRKTDAPGFKRLTVSTKSKLVVFSDHHMTHRGHRQDWFQRFNFDLYLEVLKIYGGEGYSLVENGDVEELVIFEPTLKEAKKRRDLVRKPLFKGDIGEINWDELVGIRIENRRKTLERMFDDNKKYYDTVKGEFGKGRYYKLSGNHDAWASGVLEDLIETQYWPGVISDVVRVERKSTKGSVAKFIITHGHQFDHSCCPPHAKQVGETISECIAWGYQGADRVWKISDTRKWTSASNRKFGNVLSSMSSEPVNSGSPALESLLECLLEKQVAWEYFENSDPLVAYNKEVLTGDEFFKVRHMDENVLANHILPWAGMDVVPTLICGHTHEPRDRSKFVNTLALGMKLGGVVVPAQVKPKGTNDLNLFTHYMNSGSVGRFENLIWGIEIDGDEAQVVSWTNIGTAKNMVPKKTIWKSDDKGNLIGTEVATESRSSKSSSGSSGTGSSRRVVRTRTRRR